MRFTHNNQGTCSRSVSFDIEDGKVKNIEFLGGCAGNLLAISKICDGMDVQHVIDTFRGNRCGMKPTSCADQLADGLEKAVAYMNTHKE